ncbi:MAG: hypothetical protein ACKO5F_06305 [Synechococcus sp.]
MFDLGFSGATPPGTYSLLNTTAALATLPILTSGGENVVYGVSFDEITGVYTLIASISARPVFTLTLDSQTGAYQFDLLAQLDHAPGLNENNLLLSFGAIVQAVDASGTPLIAPATDFQITVNDDTPITAPAPLEGFMVDEDGGTASTPANLPGLDGSNPGGVGDAGLSTPPVIGLVVEGSVAGMFRLGADQITQMPTGTYDLIDEASALKTLSDQLLKSGGSLLSYSVSGNTLTAFVPSSGAELQQRTVFIFEITDSTSGAFKFTLLDQLDHAAGQNENDLTLNLGGIVRAMDFDQDPVIGTAALLQFTVNDDTPIWLNGGPSNTIVGSFDDSVVGAMPFSIGADADGFASFIPFLLDASNLDSTNALPDSHLTATATLDDSGWYWAPTNLTSAGKAVWYAVNSSAPSVLYATTDRVSPPSGSSDTLAFTVQASLADQTYRVDVQNGVDTGFGQASYLAFSKNPGNGQQAASQYYLAEDGTLNQVEPFETIATFYSSLSDAEVKVTGGPGGSPFIGMSGDGNGAAWVSSGALVVDPGDQGGDEFLYVTLAKDFSAVVDFKGNAGMSQAIDWKIYLADGTSLKGSSLASPLGKNGPDAQKYQFDITKAQLDNLSSSDDPLYYSISRVELSPAGRDFRLGGVSFADQPTALSAVFEITINDQDLDAITEDFRVTFAPEELRAPVALDLDGDGKVSYLASAEGTRFDFNDDGQPELTPWVAANDGLLAYDHNQDGVIDEGREIVFTSWGTDSDVQTDLQALGRYFDSNQDGVLDSTDSNWQQFGVWQDADSDGVQDAGEFRSLDDLGIASIDLQGDGVSSTAAEGDVLIHGTTEVTYADGSTTIAQDVTFAALLDQALADPTQLALLPVDTALPEAPAVDPADLTALVEAYVAAEPASEPQPGDAVAMDDASTTPDEPIALSDGSVQEPEPLFLDDATAHPGLDDGNDVPPPQTSVRWPTPVTEGQGDGERQSRSHRIPGGELPRCSPGRGGRSRSGLTTPEARRTLLRTRSGGEPLPGRSPALRRAPRGTPAGSAQFHRPAPGG